MKLRASPHSTLLLSVFDRILLSKTKEAAHLYLTLKCKVMNVAVLADPQLVAICVIAGLVSMLTTLNVAARPAAVRTSRVMLAFSVGGFFFLLTRFANLFYAPLMARFVDAAEKSGNLGLLSDQISWVLLGSALGGVASWALLPTFVELYGKSIYCLEYRGTFLGMAPRLVARQAWGRAWDSLRAPGTLGVKPFQLGRVPAGFLLINVLATAVWSVGVLASLLVSAQHPEMAQTAVLLSGLVNAFAAISFSLWVDPKAALITDQAIKGVRPHRDVDIATAHLALGNMAGGFLGFLFFKPAVCLISLAGKGLAAQGNDMSRHLWIVVGLNLLFALLVSTTYVSRISAVRTKKVAMAVAVYNLFFLVARLGQQALGPLLGSISDFFAQNQLSEEQLSILFRKVLLGATLGTVMALLLLPTMVAVYDVTIERVERRGSLFGVLLGALNPFHWTAVARCLRRPSLFGLRLEDLHRIPKFLVVANLLVVAVHSVGVVSSVYAGFALPELKRTACLLSSVINGLATVTLALAVEPTVSLITEEVLQGKRSRRDVYALAVLLTSGMLLGTLLSQLLLEPAKEFVVLAAKIFAALF